EVERGGHVERLQPHVQQTGYRLRRRVGVQRGEHHVPRERGLDRDTTCLQVADLSHHDDVGVLTEERLQRGGKRHPDLGAYLHLVVPEEVVLHGFLHRHYVRVDVVDLALRGVQGGGLSRPRWTRHQYHAVRILHGLHQIR